MVCERWREMLSAQLDGEDDPAGRTLIDEHLAGCAGCRAWLDRAAAVTRMTRTGPAVQVPDLSAAILAAAPGPRRRLLTRGRLFAALALVGAVQLILGLSQVGGVYGSHTEHPGLNATAGHLWHESAAWNVALGAAFLFIALRRSRPTGLLPMLSAFVGMLLLLSLNDLSAARVDADRLTSHGFVLAGFLLVLALSRLGASPAQPPGARAASWKADFGDAADDLGDHPHVPSAPLRLLPRPGPMTARHDVRAPGGLRKIPDAA